MRPFAVCGSCVRVNLGAQVRGWRGQGMARSGKNQEWCAYFGEGEVFGRAAGALLPVEEEAAVAFGEAGAGVDVELGEGLVDPCGGAFELGPVTDGGFVDDEVAEAGVVGCDGVRPLGAVLFIDEGRGVAELVEDLRESGAFCDDGFGLDADLVACGIGGVVGTGLALVGDGAELAVLPDAEELAVLAQAA